MAITYVGGSHDFAGNMSTTGPLVLSWPGGHQADDFAIIFGFVDNQSATNMVMDTSGPTAIDVGIELNGRNKAYGLWVWRATSGSMADVEISHTSGEEGSAAILVFRGVDTTTAFDATEEYDATADSYLAANPAITTVTESAAAVLLEALTHNAITAAGAPSGYTLGPVNTNPGQNNRNMATAYLLDVGAAGTETPGAWTHTGDTQASLSDPVKFTIALRPAATGPVELDGSGSDAATLTGTGAATALLDGSGTDQATNTADGAATALMDGSGADGGSITAAGTALVVLDGSGAESAALTAAGTALVDMDGAGTEQATVTAAGAATALLDGAGIDQATIVGDGMGTAVMAGSGSDAATVSGSGTALHLLDAAGSDALTLTAAGSVVGGVVDLDGSGSDALTLSGVGTAVHLLDASGSDAAAMTAAESIVHQLDGAGTESATVAGTGAATALLAGDETELASIVSAGTAVAELAGSGSDALTLTAAGGSAISLDGSGADALTMTAAGAATALLESSGADALTIAGAGTGLVFLAGSGADALSLTAAGSKASNTGGPFMVEAVELAWRTESVELAWSIVGAVEPMRIESASNEKVLATLRALESDPTATVIEFATSTDGETPGTNWAAGSWHSDGWSSRTGLVRAFSPTLGTGASISIGAGTYWLWARIDNGPIKRVGLLDVS